MKFTWLCLIMLMVSCAGQEKQRKTVVQGSDAFERESFHRWDDRRLSSLEGKDALVGLCHQGKTEEALLKYRSQFATKEENPYYWVHVGNCQLIGGAPAKADFSYRLALAETKSPLVKAMVHNNLGLIELKSGRWEHAREHFELAMILAPKSLVPHYNLAQLLLHFGHHEKALVLLTSPLFNKASGDSDVNFSLANAYVYRGDLTKAGEHFSRLPADAFEREEVALTYALYLVKKGDAPGARRALKAREISSEPELQDLGRQIELLIERRTTK